MKQCLVKRYLLTTILVLLSVLLPSILNAESKPLVLPNIKKNHDVRIWNLKDVSIQSVVAEVSAETGKNFIIDPRVKGKVTMISAHPLSPDELYQAFLALLQLHGYSVIPEGKILKIIPSNNAKTAGGKVVDSSDQAFGAERVVRVIHVKYVNVKELYNSLRQLVSREAHIAAYEPSNDVIIADTAANVRRIAGVIARLDKPTASGTELIRLRYASATEIASTLDGLIKADKTKRGTNPVRIAVDERTNSILIAGGRGNRLQLRTLVAKLDTPSSTGGNTHVIYLKYIRAKDLAPILANVISNYSTEYRLDQSGQSKSGGQTATAPLRQPLAARSSGPLSDSLTSISSRTGSSSRGSLLERYGQSSNFNLPDDSRQRSGSVGAVQWEETTNSVIVKAPPGLMRTIRSVIARLDIRRPQVLVEAIVAEVGLTRARELGVEWNTNGQVPAATRFDSDVTTTLSNAAGGTNTLAGAASGVPVGQGLTVGFFKNGNLRAIVRALASDVSTNILSTPNVVTLDNETATIKVGQLVPFAIGTSTDTTAQGGAPFTSFEREEVGLSLTIRPQITHSGAIKMYIQHILSSIIPGTADNNPGENPTTAERVIATNVMVDNNSILVLGGLIQTNWQSTESKVPILGDMPVIGAAFRSNGRRLEKTNLMIFLKPIIMRDDEDGVQITNGKYGYIRGRQLDAQRNILRPYTDESPSLPPPGGERHLPSPFAVQELASIQHELPPPAFMQGHHKKPANKQAKHKQAKHKSEK